MRRLLAAALSALAFLFLVYAPAAAQDKGDFSGKNRIVIGGNATTLDTVISAVRGVNRSPHHLQTIGDSQTARNHLVSSTAIWSQWTGYAVQLNALSGGRFRYDKSDNLGVVGDRAVQAAARVPTIIAGNAGTVIFHIGTNDAFYWASFGPGGTNVAPSTYPQDTVASITSTANQLADAGILVVLVPPQQNTLSFYTTVSGLTSAQAQTAYRFTVMLNKAMIALTKTRRGIIFSDPSAGLMDPGALGGPYTADLTDGRHYGPQAAYVIGKQLAKDIAPFVPNYEPVPVVDPYDVFANDNPKGNLLSNAFFTGAPNTVSTAPLTGSLAPSWSPQVSSVGTISSGSAVFSVVPRPDGLGYGIRLVVTNLKGTGNAVALGFGQTVTVDETKLLTGDILQERALITQAAGQVGVVNMGLRVAESDGSGTVVDVQGAAQGSTPFWWSSDALQLTLDTPTFPIRPSGGAGSRNINARFFVTLDTTGASGASCDVTFWAPALRKQ